MQRSDWLDEITLEEALDIDSKIKMSEATRLFTDFRKEEVWGTDGFGLWRCFACDHTWPDGREDCHNCYIGKRPGIEDL